MQAISPTINSLLNQKAHIDELILWIPKTYRRQNFAISSVPKLPLPTKILYTDVDYGPATKVLPAVKHFRGQDVKIIYCDDDQIYEPGWAEYLLEQSRLFPKQCITACGKKVKQVCLDYFVSRKTYKSLNFLSKGVLKRYCHKRGIRLKPGNGPVDICQGFGGVLIEPGFFTDKVFDIPEILWTVDDVWLSGQLAINSIPIRLVSSHKRWQQKNLEAHKIAPLKKHVRDDCRRVEANMMCVNFFRKMHGIWL
jgi:hypothetical protein